MQAGLECNFFFFLLLLLGRNKVITIQEYTLDLCGFWVPLRLQEHNHSEMLLTGFFVWFAAYGSVSYFFLFGFLSPTL